MSIRFTIPVRTVSPNRVRGVTRGAALGHAARKKHERETARLCALAALRTAAEETRALIRAITPADYTPPAEKSMMQRSLERQWAEPRVVAVTLTRVAPRPLDRVNLVASMKAVEDGVADAIQIDDGSPFWKADFAQRRGKVREHCVEVRIE